MLKDKIKNFPDLPKFLFTLNSNLKIGDKVKITKNLLECKRNNNYGFFLNDIGIITDYIENGKKFLIEVKGRKSTSMYAPGVLFPNYCLTLEENTHESN